MAQQLGLSFIDADDEHPAENIEKMKAGIPLTDEDRVPWLQKVRSRAISASSQNGVVIACSALKQVYRNLLEE
ncbi:gluconokinase, partial [Acinetobacter baumannii]